MRRFAQSPTDPAFVQDPYPFYARLRSAGSLAWWDAYGMPVASHHGTVDGLLRDRRFGRENPAPADRAAHQAAFWAVEDHSMLEAEPPRHTRLRGQVLRSFTSRRIAGMADELRALARDLASGLPDGPFDLLDAFCRPLPVRVIARLLGVPEDDAGQLLGWSNRMVQMYQAARTVEQEAEAARAASEFSAYIEAALDRRARHPDASLLSHLLRAEAEGALSRAEIASTAILLLNAGHEATVHTLGNAVQALLRNGLWPAEPTEALVEELIRIDPPLHLFTRYALEDVTVLGHDFRRGDQVGLLLAAACHDPAAYDEPERLQPGRFPAAPSHAAFGAGIHFCLGAPLARMEIREALRALGERRPALRIAETPRYAPVFHFHGLERLVVEG